MFDKVIGYHDEKVELARILDTILNESKYTAMGVKTPRNILLHGDPGIGKSLLANEFAKATGKTIYVIRKDKPDGEFINYIKETFVKAAENRGLIVLEDLCKFANSDARNRDTEEYVCVQSCIDETRDKVFVIATVNDINKLPISLVRSGRFDKTIKMKYPKGKCAAEIVAYFLKNKNVDESVSSEEISRIMDGHSCAELEQIVNDAGVYAIYEGRSKISRNDLIRSAMRIIFNAPESYVECKEEDLRRLAVHEAGHCLVTEILEPGSVNLVSVNRYNGTIGGITSYKNNESYFFSAKYMEYRVISLLAGKAATEIVYADTDIGCNNDVMRAFDIVERFVDDYCNFGFDKFQRCGSSPALIQKKETFMHSELDRFYKIAKQLIIENRLFFDEIVRQLMDKKTLASEDIKNIKKNYCNSKLSV